MSTPMTDTQGHAFIRRLRFAAPLETAFQESYYGRMRSAVRGSIAIFAVISVLTAFLVSMDRVNITAIVLCLSVVVANVALIVCSRRDSFSLIWQPAVVVTTLISLFVMLFGTAEDAAPSTSLLLLLIACRIQRLQLRWMALQFAGILVVGALAILIHSPTSPGKVVGALIGALIFMAVPLFSTLKHERYERSEFWAKHVLAQERNEERDKREQTEKMLHVLSQAIGGIVHDLGNPLTAVQSGAETLLMFVKEGEPDKETVQEFAEIITDGAQMLNYLRLSLMEQTRVLEGKPVPIEPKPTSVMHMVKAGMQYQKPKFSAGRSVCVRGDDLEVCVDELRFITVFMNLIGNALKYSDGEVRITWRTFADKVLIAVCDQGRAAQGISREQAQQLFVPFGRLDTHAKIEGTGLGLLSVKTIAEAHEGEVYIEGNSNSEFFSTATASYPSMLELDFRTAFVTACPLPILSQPPVEEQELQCEEPSQEPSQLPIFQDAVAAPNEQLIAAARRK